MTRPVLAMLAVALVGAAIGGYAWLSPRAQAADEFGRDLTAQWLTDPSRHVSPTYVHVVASTTSVADYTIDLQIDDPNGGAPLVSTSITGPNGAAGGYAYIEDSLWGYPPSTAFSILATFKDPVGTPTATKSIVFVKP
jgi:hypothetical protein